MLHGLIYITIGIWIILTETIVILAENLSLKHPLSLNIVNIKRIFHIIGCPGNIHASECC